MPIARQSRTVGEVLNKEAEWFSSVKQDKNDESESKSEEDQELKYRLAREGCTMRLEKRIIALERALEAILRRLEASTSPDDEAGWFGRPE